MASVPPIEWVKLIPANSIPVFCLSPDVLDMDMVRIRHELAEFFGDRKFLVIRSGDVQIYAIADPTAVSTEGASWAMENATPSFSGFYCGVQHGPCTRDDCIGAWCALSGIPRT